MEHTNMAQHVPTPLPPQVLEACPIGVLAADQDGVVTWLNAAMEEFLGVAAAEVTGKALEGLPTGTEVIHMPAAAERPERWLRHWRQVVDAAGSTQIVHYCTDITQYIQAHEERDRLARELEQKATSDPLTGLLNHRALMLGLEPQVSRSRRYQNPLSVVLMSLEGIDEFDDLYGGRAKEQALNAIGQLLKDQMRWADLIGRMNTGDFLLILPETEADAAKKLVEKISEAVAQLRLSGDGGVPIRIRPQFGIAQWVKGDDPSLLLKRAGEALGSAAVEQVG